jgi:hypothetical protein
MPKGVVFEDVHGMVVNSVDNAYLSGSAGTPTPIAMTFTGPFPDQTVILQVVSKGSLVFCYLPDVLYGDGPPPVYGPQLLVPELLDIPRLPPVYPPAIVITKEGSELDLIFRPLHDQTCSNITLIAGAAVTPGKCTVTSAGQIVIDVDAEGGFGGINPVGWKGAFLVWGKF